jgi:hypothetical protein
MAGACFSQAVIVGPSGPDIRWIEEKGKFYMWGHRRNSQTELWTSKTRSTAIRGTITERL